MPLDFNLLGESPRINTPFENLSQILQVRNQQEAGRGLAEQRRSQAAQTDERTKLLQQQQADTASIDTALGSGGTPEEMLAKVPGHLRATIQKQFQEAAEWNQKVKDAKATAEKAELGYAAHLASGVLSWEKDGPDAFMNAAQIALQLAKKDGHDISQIEGVIQSDPTKLKPMLESIIARHQGPQAPRADYTLGEQRFSGATNQPIATAPTKVTYGAPQPMLVNGRRSVVRPGSDGQIYSMDMKPIPANAIAPDPRVEAQGPQPGWQWVNRNGEEVYTNRVAQGDKPQNVRAKVTEDERKMAGFHGQMSDAIQTIDKLENAITEKELYQIQTLPQEKLIGMVNRNELSEGAKRYLRAFEQFTESRLRPVSGAAIADSEYARDRRTYAKQYGETPELAKDRARARALALDSLKKRAGIALDDTSPSAGAKPKADPLGIR